MELYLRYSRSTVEAQSGSCTFYPGKPCSFWCPRTIPLSPEYKVPPMPWTALVAVRITCIPALLA
jgi:hypothetical protein